MREILFRGKRVDNGKWVYGGYAHIYSNPNTDIIVTGRMCLYEDSGELTMEARNIDPSTIGQYTGLTDKNGKKIFEGDICRIKEHGDVDLAVISFEHGAFYATPHNANIHEHTLWDIWYNDYDIEVIGNIHDNPEMLEVTE